MNEITILLWAYLSGCFVSVFFAFIKGLFNKAEMDGVSVMDIMPFEINWEYFIAGIGFSIASWISALVFWEFMNEAITDYRNSTEYLKRKIKHEHKSH